MLSRERARARVFALHRGDGNVPHEYVAHAVIARSRLPGARNREFCAFSRAVRSLRYRSCDALDANGEDSGACGADLRMRVLVAPYRCPGERRVPVSVRWG